jgi:hypothetical protein
MSLAELHSSRLSNCNASFSSSQSNVLSHQGLLMVQSIDTKSLLKKIDHNPKAYFLHNPKGHHANANALYTSLKRALTKQYYGNTVKDEEHSFKGTIFSKLTLPYEVFHL